MKGHRLGKGHSTLLFVVLLGTMCRTNCVCFNQHAFYHCSYELKSILGNEVGLLTCFVQSITTYPTSCIGLEEIELLSARKSLFRSPSVAIGICEFCIVAARVVVVVLGSYFLTMGKANVFYDLEMEFKIFLGQMLINGFVNYKSKYFFLG